MTTIEQWYRTTLYNFYVNAMLTSTCAQVPGHTGKPQKGICKAGFPRNERSNGAPQAARESGLPAQYTQNLFLSDLTTGCKIGEHLMTIEEVELCVEYVQKHALLCKVLLASGFIGA